MIFSRITLPDGQFGLRIVLDGTEGYSLNWYLSNLTNESTVADGNVPLGVDTLTFDYSSLNDAGRAYFDSANAGESSSTWASVPSMIVVGLVTSIILAGMRKK